MRLIDADALKNIHGMKDDCAECDKELRHKSRSCEFDRVYTLMDFCGWIDDAPTIEPEQRWISCKKRLPKELQEVYTTVYWNDYGDYITAYGMRTKFGWYLTSASEGELIKGYTVIAWMPLPEPYRGDNE